MNWVLETLGESIFRADGESNLPTISRALLERAAPVRSRGYKKSTDGKSAKSGAATLTQEIAQPVPPPEESGASAASAAST